MTAKKNTSTVPKESNKEYVLVGYSVDDCRWCSGRMCETKEDAHAEALDSWGELANKFFLEVKLPETPETTTEIEKIPVFTV